MSNFINSSFIVLLIKKKERLRSKAGNKLRSPRLRWYGLVKRREEGYVVWTREEERRRLRWYGLVKRREEGYVVWTREEERRRLRWYGLVKRREEGYVGKRMIEMANLVKEREEDRREDGWIW